MTPGLGKERQVQPAFIAPGVRVFVSIAELGELLASEKMSRKVTLLITLHICIC